MKSTQEKNDPFSIEVAARELAEKYREMATLRRHDREGTLADPRPRMRALAARFPGALREIDELPDEELARRVLALSSGDLNAADARWVEASFRYHRALRRHLADATRAGRPSHLALADVARELGASLDEVRRLVHPHRRRRNHP